MTPAQREIWTAVRDANRAWLEGRPRGVEPLFHEDVVGVPPGFGPRTRGREAMVQSFEDYCAHVKTHVFEESDPEVDVFGDVAVVTYRFAIRYESGGQMVDEQGREILAFKRESGNWRVVWRAQVPDKA